MDYIHQVLTGINTHLKKSNGRLNTFYGDPTDVFENLSEKYDIQAVFCNRDYEPETIQRDTRIYQFFTDQNIPFHAHKDQVIFDKKWLALLTEENHNSYPLPHNNFVAQEFAEIHSLREIGFENGNWQWAASSGCDAAPYFRVFNPALQTEKFDRDLEYIKRWLPEFDSNTYTKPMVEHGFARDRALRFTLYPPTCE